MRVTLRSKTDYRRTLLRNQLTSLVHFESVKTTKNQAKQLVAFANHFFNQIKASDVNSRRRAAGILFSPLAIKKVFDDLLPRYSQETTTFVRPLSLGRRLGDNAALTLISFLPALKQSPATTVTKPSKGKDDS